jgi:hypothetical protein
MKCREHIYRFGEARIMDATVVDLRYRMRQVLAALDRQEPVNVLYHGKIKGVIMPLAPTPMKTEEHEYFGSSPEPDDATAVAKAMAVLRGGRHRDL